MDLIKDESRLNVTRLPDIDVTRLPMFQKVVDMFAGRPEFQRLVNLANMGYTNEMDDSGEDDILKEDYSEDDYEFKRGEHGDNNSQTPSVQVQGKESNGQRQDGELQEAEKKEKNEKKRLKKQKQKERRRTLENEEEDTELDMTSMFVSKAFSIATKKLEQNPRLGRRENKKSPEKECKTFPKKINEDQKDKKESATCSCPSLEENVIRSTELASTGNQFASVGDFKTAVKFFTEAIKHNPTEFKLFGNRSFCFERMQEYTKALTDAELSLSICPGWVKGLFRKGRALAGLKRYDEAAMAFRDVLQLDNSCAEAAQELMRVQITQLMEHGFSREQSSNALIIHGTVKKALDVLSSLNTSAGAQYGTLPSLQVASASRVSPVLSANRNSALPPSRDPPETQLQKNPPGPVQNTPDVASQQTPAPNQAMKTTSENSHGPQELFPVWLGYLSQQMTQSMITNLFNKAGEVHSVKMLVYRRCAFVNFTKQEYCEEAIRLFHGYDLKGEKLAVRYPDRVPRGMGISQSAHTSDMLNEYMGQNHYFDGRNAAGDRRPVYPHQHFHNYRGNY